MVHIIHLRIAHKVGREHGVLTDIVDYLKLEEIILHCLNAQINFLFIFLGDSFLINLVNATKNL